MPCRVDGEGLDTVKRNGLIGLFCFLNFSKNSAHLMFVLLDVRIGVSYFVSVCFFHTSVLH